MKNNVTIHTTIISSSDICGGAARAAYRLHIALNENSIIAEMMVRNKKSDLFTIDGPRSNAAKLASIVRPGLGQILFKLQKNSDTNLRSANWLTSRWAKKINCSQSNVVNLHWVGGDCLSIEDIGSISKPQVWTLHDMWAFCGAEHYASDGKSARWREGYRKDNRYSGDSKVDLDRWVWTRKKKSWKNLVEIVSPSNWLANCAAGSDLFKNFPITVIPNVIDTKVFQQLDKHFCRKVLNLPQDKKLLLFGAMGGGNDPRKGMDLLLSSLLILSKDTNNVGLECIVFGQSQPEILPEINLPIHWLGHISDDSTLALLYNAADVMIVPSRQENLPQTATEAQSCGCPVVAFNCTGLPDAVEHLVTGYLAEAFDTQDLANGILWVLQSENHWNILSSASRDRALRLWDASVIVPKYLDVYRKAICNQR